MLFPDCLGLKLSEAKRLLESFELLYQIKEIKPFFKGKPKETVLSGIPMVIGQKSEENSVILTVCQVPEEGDEHARK